MAEAISLNKLAQEDKEFVKTTLDCDGEKVFDREENTAYLPLAFARQNFDLEKHDIVRTECHLFAGLLRQEQLDARAFVVDKLTCDGYATICARPGFGKTITAIAIACTLSVKTLIVVNRLVLIDQWVSAIWQFAPSAVTSVVNPKSQELDPNATFYIVNAANMHKHPHSYWSSIKFLIVDELHQIITKKLVIGLLRTVPDAILGLSATPYRYDSYHKAISWFFGNNQTGKALMHNHTFRIVDTGFVPQNVHYTSRGLDWTKILSEQSENIERNECIAKQCIAEIDNDRTILVLVKRIAQAEMLMEMIKDKNPAVNVASLLRSARTFDKNCRILIGTTSKIGVGFDHAPINCLVVAADIKNYFVQFLGRCMRNPDTIPLVVDFRDNFNVLSNHLDDRIKEYLMYGGREETITHVTTHHRRLAGWCMVNI